jgi:protein O-GlcNAc transferase
MTTSPDLLTSAIAHHQAGRLAEAEALYRQILTHDPRHVDALHLLGLVAHQGGAHEAAIELIGQAIRLRGDQPVFHSNLGEVYRALGRDAEAMQCFQQALRLNPSFADAHNNLGNVLLNLGQLTEAEAAFHEAIRLRPGFAPPYNNLGLVEQRRRNLDGAIPWYRQALQVNPRYTLALCNLGAALAQQGDTQQAIDCYQRAVALEPNNSEMHLRLGAAYQGQAKLVQAAASYREAIRHNPRSAHAHHNLGTVLKDLGQVELAIASYREALRCNPQQADTYTNLAIALADRDNAQEADEMFRRALELKPGDPEILCSYGNVLESQGKLDEALALYQQAASSRPELPKPQFNLGNVYHSKGMPADALAAYERAVALAPEFVDALNNLAMVYNDLSQPDRALEVVDRGLELAPKMAALHANRQIALHAQGRTIEASVASRTAKELKPHDASEHSNYLYTLNFHPGLDRERVFQEHLDWAKRHAEPLTAAAPSHENDRTPDRRLRVGYVSPYFRQHAVNFFVEPILASHDHEQFEVYCYSDVAGGDATTQRLKRAADQWRDVRYQSDAQIAEIVRSDRIDILVDLTGHIGGNRMLLFARKPAPVQVTYIGYQNTTGMSAMDYRVTDALADPPGATDAFYTERLVRLPRAFFCYRPSDDAPAIAPLPAAERGFITFGSFNNFAKVNPAVVDAWWRILARVPRSRIRVLAHRGGYLEEHLKAGAGRYGIDPGRIEMCEKRPRVDYLKLIAETDIALDPFPFNGHTTTCDTIWQGVPVVMLMGQTYASRFGGSVLANVGLEGLMAGSVDQYVDAAVELAEDRARLVELRAGLRPAMAASPLLDFAGFTRNLEHAYRQMWITWCQPNREPPSPQR